MEHYCEIYISKTEESFLKTFLTEIILENNVIKDKISFIDFNDDYDNIKETAFPDGFLFFKYLLNLTFVEGTDISDCAKITSKILTELWNKNISAIASCDYEDLLIKNGGYKSKEVPWPA